MRQQSRQEATGRCPHFGASRGAAAATALLLYKYNSSIQSKRQYYRSNFMHSSITPNNIDIELVGSCGLHLPVLGPWRYRFRQVFA